MEGETILENKDVIVEDSILANYDNEDVNRVCHLGLIPALNALQATINAPAEENPNEYVKDIASKYFRDACGTKRTPMCIEAGKDIIEVDEDDIENEAKQCVYDIIRRVTYQKGDKPYSSSDLKAKLDALWKITNFYISPIVRGFYHIF